MSEPCPLDRSERFIRRFKRPSGYTPALDLAPVEEEVTEEIPSKTDDPRYVTVGMTGKATLFTRRGKHIDEGYVRIDGKTVSGYVPRFGLGGKVFFPFTQMKNAKLAA